MTLGLLLAVALGVRIAHWTQTVVMQKDGPVFLRLARAVSDGEPGALWEHAYHPLYPLATAAVHALGPDLERAAVGVSIAGGVGAVLGLYVFLRAGFDAVVARTGALLLALHPYAVSFSGDVQSDGLYLGLLLLALAALWRGYASARAAPALVAGLLAGLAYLTRPEGVSIALLGVGLAALAVVRRAWSPGRATRFSAALAAGLMLMMTPYLVLLRVQHDALMLTPKKSLAGMLGFGDVMPPPSVTARSAGFLERVPTASVASGPRRRAGERPPEASAPAPSPSFERQPQPVPAEVGLLERHAHALYDLLDTAGSSLPWILLPLVVIGILSLRGRPGPRGRFVLGYVVLQAAVLYALLVTSGYVSRRHTLPMVAPALGYAAVGVPIAAAALARLSARLRPGRRVPGPHALSTALLAVLAIGLLAPLAGGGREIRRAEREAAEWVGAQLREGEAVAARRERVAYYAGAPYVSLGHSPHVDFVAYLRHLGVRFVIVDTRKLERYPGLAREREALRHARSIERAGRRIEVFEVPATARGAARDGAGEPGEG